MGYMERINESRVAKETNSAKCQLGKATLEEDGYEERFQIISRMFFKRLEQPH